MGVRLSVEVADQIGRWGRSRGYRNRSSAIRAMIDRALKD